MNVWMKLPLLLPLMFQVPAPVPAGRAPASSAQTPEADSAQEIEIVVWVPKYANARALRVAVGELLFTGGFSSTIAQPDLVNVMDVDQSLLIAAPNEYMGPVLDILQELDQATPPNRVAEGRVVREYTIRHISMPDAIDALLPLSREIQELGSGPTWLTSQNLSFIRSRGIVVVRDTQARVDQILELLERIDVPRPQILLRSYLIRGVEGPHDARIPGEVVAGLRELVPYTNFELVSFAMVRTDVTADIAMTDSAVNEQYRMVLDPEAYDPEAQRLTLSECRFDISRQEGGANVNRQFSTSASLIAGEYTVLGGVGADADFLVLHMALVK